MPVNVQITATASGAPMLEQNGYTLTCIVCKAENFNPTITYQWTKNNGTETQIQVGADPTVLSLSPLRLSDAGRYTCQATVSYGGRERQCRRGRFLTRPARGRLAAF